MGRVADGMMAKLRARFQPSRLELIDESRATPDMRVRGPTERAIST